MLPCRALTPAGPVLLLSGMAQIVVSQEFAADRGEVRRVPWMELYVEG